MNKMKYKQYLLQLSGFAALAMIMLSGVVSPVTMAAVTDKSTGGSSTTTTTTNGGGTTTITCTNGTQVNVPASADKNAACGSYGGYVAPSGSTTTPNANACPDEGDCAKKTAFAFNCGGNRGSVTENVGISCLFIMVINFMSVAVGLAVVGGVTVGGIMYSTSGGSPGKTQQGVKIIVNSLIGLVLWLLLWAIVQFLIPGGVFTS